MTVALAHINVWDSEFFGFKIAHTTDPMMRREAESVWTLIDASDIDRTRSFEDRGFRHADIRVTLERSDETRWEPFHDIGPAVPIDTEPLAKLARHAHRDSRYYNVDYPSERCDDLYETWMRNSLDGWADSVLTSGDEGDPTGYITLHIDGDTAKVGLCAVRPDMRGQELGRSLVHAAIDRALLGGADKMTVVTQGANIAALRLYEGCGFKTSSVEIWMHRFAR